jgi:hypothetical protein
MFIYSQKETQMMKYYKSIITVLAMIVLIAGLSGCNAGPLERAGKKVDKTVEDITK